MLVRVRRAMDCSTKDAVSDSPALAAFDVIYKKPKKKGERVSIFVLVEELSRLDDGTSEWFVTTAPDISACKLTFNLVKKRSPWTTALPERDFIVPAFDIQGAGACV